MSQQDKKTSNGNINMHIKQYYYISFKIQNLASFYGIYIQRYGKKTGGFNSSLEN